MDEDFFNKSSISDVDFTKKTFGTLIESVSEELSAELEPVYKISIIDIST